MLSPRLRDYCPERPNGLIFDGRCDVFDSEEEHLAEDNSGEEDLGRDGENNHNSSSFSPGRYDRQNAQHHSYHTIPRRPCATWAWDGPSRNARAGVVNGDEVLSTPSRIPISKRMLDIRFCARCERLKPVTIDSRCEVDFGREGQQDFTREHGDSEGDAANKSDPDSFYPGRHDAQQNNSYNSIDLPETDASLIVDMTMPIDLMEPDAGPPRSMFTVCPLKREQLTKGRTGGTFWASKKRNYAEGPPPPAEPGGTTL
ncbi:hypothetical protein B0H11DRAFT_1908119 [Mycena galericulata]|nr:hypothetical protein B0H11DRAFT_1908119 [Mycena galericulata]